MEPATIAGVLLAVTPATSQCDLPLLLVKRLEHCSWEEKAPIARSLVEILKTIPNEATDKYLVEFTQKLISSQGQDGGDERRSDNLPLAVKLAMMHPELSRGLMDEGLKCLGEVIDIARKVHVSSDDGFAVPSLEFMVKFPHASVGSLEARPVRDEDSDFLETQTRALAYLKFYELFLMTESQGEILQKPEMIYVLLVLLGHSNCIVVSLSGRVLRLLLQALARAGSEGGDTVREMVYYRLQDLTAGVGREGHELYTIWFQWVSTCACGPSQEMLREAKYWEMIQRGMLRGFSAQRKICLQILNLSINLLRNPIQNEHFIWDEKSRESTIQAWKKYATLFEIIVFDTSANQLKDALPELHRLLTPSSQIHRSWVSVLLSLGLKNSSTSIQATVYELLLSLQWQQLEFFTEGEDMFLTEYFLPYAMTGSHFTISGEHNEKCEHGENLAKFLAGILSNSPEQLAIKLMDTVLSYIIDRPDTIFSPARIYILLGMVNGIGRQRILGPSQIQKVVRVASNKRFSRTRAELSTSLCLRLLFSARLENTIEAKRDYLCWVCSCIKGSVHIFGFQEAKSFAGCILEGMTFPQDFWRLERNVMNTNEVNSGSDDSANFLRPVEQEGAQRALLDTLFAVCGEVDEQSMRTVLRWTVDVDAALLHDIPHIFDFGYPLIDAILSNTSFRKQLFETLSRCADKLVTERCFIPVDELHKKALSKMLNGLHSASQRQRSQIPLAELNVLALKLFDAAWERQRDASQSNFWETRKNRSHSLRTCSAAAKVLNGSGSHLPISSSDALDIIEGYPEFLQHDIDSLGEGSHMNVEITKAVEQAIDAAFSLLEVTLKQELSNYDGQRIIGCINRHLRFITNQALRPVVNCLKVIAGPSSSTYKQLTISCAVELWDLAEQARSGSDTQGVYLELFELLFDPTSRDSDSVGEISRISKEALKYSITRRSIAPTLARTLCTLPSEALMPHLSLIMGFINLVQLKEVDYLQEESLCVIMDRLNDCTPGTYYNHYNGPREIAAQAHIFGLLSRLNPNVTVDVDFVRSLRRELLGPWRDTKSAVQFSTHKKTSQLQALLVTDRFVGREDADEFLQMAFTILNYETHPRYRFLFEWMIVRVAIRLPEEMTRIWKLLDPCERLNPRTQVSLIKIAMMIASSVAEEEKLAYYEKLVNTITPLISNSKVATRHLAITSVLAIWKNATDLGFASITNNSLFMQIRQQILNSPFYLDATPAEKVQSETVFNPSTNYTLLGIFHGTYLLGGDPIERITGADFLAVDGILGVKGDSFIPLGTTTATAPTTTSPVEYPRTIETALTARTINPTQPRPLQTKSSTWTTENPASTTPMLTHPKSLNPNFPSLLLLASLITNPTNLGGLSRVSEIFGATTLCLSSLTSTTSPAFLSVSVSSQHWLPFTEVSIPAIPQFLRDKRNEGYSIVGIEQTDQSVILGKEGRGGLPRKAVLMLGSEREGIPAELLGEVDMCVEIEQRGETRSLNVQTAAAVVCYEWNRQWRQ
ncbi:hypothetical protein BGX38DRAFT_1272962 [Terfezia claveryi]|nr:hypothetical protein BGX38DRAFT_1272962 [Terfezia claveryi]